MAYLAIVEYMVEYDSHTVAGLAGADEFRTDIKKPLCNCLQFSSMRGVLSVAPSGVDPLT